MHLEIIRPQSRDDEEDGGKGLMLRWDEHLNLIMESRSPA
jgi:hypothetical protein